MEYKQLREELDKAKQLLCNARYLLSDVYCYETETYKNICKFLDGEDEEECCDDCDEPIDDCQCEHCDICNGNIDYNGCTCEVCDCGANLDADEGCTCDE